MHERVRGYTDAVLEELGRDTGTVAAELRGFVDLLAKLGASNRVDAARIARTKGWL